MSSLMRRCVQVGFAAALLALAAATAALSAQPAAAAACPNDNTPCKLSVGLPDGDVLGAWPTPDGKRVVFIHRPSNGTNQLYSVPVAGGAPTKLNETPSLFGFVAISPDSTRVLYLGVPAPGQPVALFSVATSGPAPSGVELASDVAVGTRDIQISPDSRKVVYLPAARNQLRVVPIAGPHNASARLTGAFAGGNAASFAINANGNSVVYMARQDSARATELYRVPLTLTPAPDPPTTKLSGPLVAGGNVGSFRLAPDARNVVYRADQDTAGVFELYRAQLNGTGKVKLSVPLPPAWNVTDFAETAGAIRGYDILADSSRVVYEIDKVGPVGQPDESQLYSVPMAGPANRSVRVDDPQNGAPQARVVKYRVSSDSQRIVYDMVDANHLFWLLTVPAAGPASASQLLAFPSVSQPLYTLSPNGRRTLHEFDPGTGDTALFSVPTAGPGSQNVRIDGAERPSVPLLVNPNSTRVVYVAATDGRDLFSAPIDGTGAPFNLTEPLDSFGIGNVGLTADSRLAVYTVQRAGSAFVELYSSRLAPTAVPANG
jgi:Tol biopolymer transport system component